jgi:hypothetical protein
MQMALTIEQSRGRRWGAVERSHCRSLEPGDDEDGVPMQPSKDEPSWRISEQSREERFPKTLFAFSQCRIAKMMVAETCSPKRRCTQTIGMERLRQQRSSEKRKILFGYLRIFQLEFPILVLVCLFLGGLVLIYRKENFLPPHQLAIWY